MTILDHIKKVQENLNSMVDQMDDDTYYYDATYHLEQIKEKIEQEPKTDRWNDPEDPPKHDRYILLSFSNFSLPLNGRYEEDEDGGGNYYIGDDTETALSQDMIVNGWQELPRCRED